VVAAARADEQQTTIGHADLTIDGVSGEVFRSSAMPDNAAHAADR
jgi:hypothetical protein